jgi:DNA polymerase-3 subunit chi
MTEISFHLNIADMQQHTLRLLHKAWRSHPQVALVGAEDFLQGISTALWAQSPSAFVPHCWAQDEQRMQDAGCLVLATPEHVPTISPQFELLIKVAQGSEPAPGFERFARLVELVSAQPQPQAVAEARQRWRHYQRRGYPLTLHDLAG